MNLRNRQFYFFHIPRTAGTTFSYSILTQYFKPEETCPPFDYQELFKLPASQLSTYKLFRGHFYYFLHRLLPARPVYMCFLRNPLERVISGYQLMLNDPTHYHHKQVSSLGSFESFLQSEYLLPDAMVRTLASDLDPRPIAEHCRMTRGADFYLDQAIAEDVYHFRPSRDELEVAKKRLSEFEFVGLQENFNASLKLLASTFGLEKPANFESRNASPVRHVDLRSMPKRALELLVSYHELDLELYQFALDLFYERLKSAGIADLQPGLSSRSRSEGAGIAKLPKVQWTDSRFKVRQGRRFTEKPLYFVHLPFAIWPELALAMERSFFLPSETCRAWAYPDLFSIPRGLYAHYRFFRGTFFQPLAAAIGRDLECMTLVPEPIGCMNRVRNFILAHPENPFYARVREMNGLEDLAEWWSNPTVKALAADFDPLEFVRKKSPLAKNEIIAEIFDYVMGMKVTKHHLELARNRLAQFAFVGIEERFSQSMDLLARTFAWRELDDPEKLNPVLSNQSELTSEARDQVLKHFSLDLELHRFATELFEHRLQSSATATMP